MQPIFFAGSQEEVSQAPTTVLTADDGTWQATLTANSQLNPAGTVYSVQEPQGDRYWLTVPNGAGPYWVGDILASPPGALSAPAFAMPGSTQFTIPGDLSVGVLPPEWMPPVDINIVGISARINDGPVVTDVILDILNKGVSIFSVHPGDRPRIVAGSNSTPVEVVPDAPSVSGLADYLQLSVVQIGTAPHPGNNCVVTVRYTFTK